MRLWDLTLRRGPRACKGHPRMRCAGWAGCAAPSQAGFPHSTLAQAQGQEQTGSTGGPVCEDQSAGWEAAEQGRAEASGAPRRATLPPLAHSRPTLSLGTPAKVWEDSEVRLLSPSKSLLGTLLAQQKPDRPQTSTCPPAPCSSWQQTVGQSRSICEQMLTLP